MQSEPLQPSSDKHAKTKSRLSFGNLLFLLFVLLFATYGAVDIFSRIFFAAKSPAAEVLLSDTASSTLPISDVFAAPFTPARLQIPVLSVNAAVELVGRKPDGSMKAPSTFTTVAWWSEGSLPGAQGNTVIAGHLNNALDTSGVFEHLNDLSLGDTVIISGASGREARYIVRQMTVYNTSDAPNTTIFSTEGSSRLVLITCDGAWDQGKRSYDKRLVVYADLVSAN